MWWGNLASIVEGSVANFFAHASGKEHLTPHNKVSLKAPCAPQKMFYLTHVQEISASLHGQFSGNALTQGP